MIVYYSPPLNKNQNSIFWKTNLSFTLSQLHLKHLTAPRQKIQFHHDQSLSVFYLQLEDELCIVRLCIAELGLFYKLLLVKSMMCLNSTQDSSEANQPVHAISVRL